MKTLIYIFFNSLRYSLEDFFRDFNAFIALYKKSKAQLKAQMEKQIREEEAKQRAEQESVDRAERDTRQRSLLLIFFCIKKKFIRIFSYFFRIYVFVGIYLFLLKKDSFKIFFLLFKKNIFLLEFIDANLFIFI